MAQGYRDTFNSLLRSSYPSYLKALEPIVINVLQFSFEIFTKYIKEKSTLILNLQFSFEIFLYDFRKVINDLIHELPSILF